MIFFFFGGGGGGGGGGVYLLSGLSYSLSFLKGLCKGYYGVPVIGLVKGDTKGLDPKLQILGL